MSLTATSKDTQANAAREAARTPLEMIQDNSDSMTAPASSIQATPQIDEEAEKSKAFEAAGGLSAAVTKSFYSSSAFIEGTANQVAMAESIGNQIQRIAGVGDWTIGAIVGSLSNLTPEERAKKEQEDSAEFADAMWEKVEREQKRQREQEEWSSRKINVGNGIEMTGEEIDTVLSALGSKDGRKKFLDAFKKKTGATEEEANKAVTDYERYMQLLRQQEIKGELTQEEKKFVQNYPQTQAGKDAIQVGQETLTNNQSKNLNLTTAAEKISIDPSANSIQETSAANARNVVVDGGITSDISLQQEWQAAQSAPQPLDVKAPAIATAPLPQQIMKPAGNDLSLLG